MSEREEEISQLFCSDRFRKGIRYKNRTYVCWNKLDVNELRKHVLSLNCIDMSFNNCLCQATMTKLNHTSKFFPSAWHSWMKNKVKRVHYWWNSHRENKVEFDLHVFIMSTYPYTVECKIKYSFYICCSIHVVVLYFKIRVKILQLTL